MRIVLFLKISIRMLTYINNISLLISKALLLESKDDQDNFWLDWIDKSIKDLGDVRNNGISVNNRCI